MDSYTTDIQVFNDTTPKLPETPLYQDISEDFGIFFYVFMIFIGTLIFCIYVIVSLNHINTIAMMDYQDLRDFK